jgi:hypothetical protein
VAAHVDDVVDVLDVDRALLYARLGGLICEYDPTA